MNRRNWLQSSLAMLGLACVAGSDPSPPAVVRDCLGHPVIVGSLLFLCDRTYEVTSIGWTPPSSQGGGQVCVLARLFLKGAWSRDVFRVWPEYMQLVASPVSL
jgi:hypothetical protein